MSKAYREQHPLLCDDLSEDDHYSPQYQRFRPMSYRGRAKYNLRGVAAIFGRWPDHWTSYLTHWWIVLGMIAITTLLVYNSLFAYAILPHETGNSLIQKANTEYQSHKSTGIPDVYMHVFKNYNDEIDLHQYLRHIKVITNKFKNFKYHLIIVMNDTSIATDDQSAEMNNEIALNSLWNKEKTIKKKPLDNNKMISVKYMTLSEYMDNSPMKKNWRNLSPHLIEFLVRAISVWEKGGIAFNPSILTPQFPHALYLEKLQKVLKDYKVPNNRLTKDAKPKKRYYKKNNKKNKLKVNNIRDVIDALDNDDIANSAQQMLAEAEDNETLRITHSGHKVFSSTGKYYAADKSVNQSDYDISIQPSLTPFLNKNNARRLKLKSKSIRNISNDSSETGRRQNRTSKINLLPLFLEYLFRNKPNILMSQENQEPNINNFTKLKITANKTKRSSEGNKIYSITDSLKDLKDTNDKYTPIVLSIKHGYDEEENSSPQIIPSKSENPNQLTIDLNGNIIATKVPCHAFIGTIFSNVVHHESSKITDFIRTELSLFCNGLLSSCVGIDFISL